ncbi:MAG: glycosyltransferase family 2 protein [Desulfobacterales bacterium]|nr:glycosyltransferase family 2 protein [Desulfobacterales bacterium]
MITIIVSVYNEEEVLNFFWEDLERHLTIGDFDYEVIFVNDGSTDDSYNVLLKLSEQNNNIKIINFSKNFGHEAAMIAGMAYSCGDIVICMDADLQHPPALLNEMIEKYNNGCEIVTMTRKNNLSQNFMQSICSRIFYVLLNLISPFHFEIHASDFFLVSRRAANVLVNDFPERTRFLRGFIQIIGFEKTNLEYVAPERSAGKSKYSFIKLFSNALIAVIAFSNLPLRLSVAVGVLTGAGSLILGIYSIVRKLMGHVVPGYTTIVVLITFLFALQFFLIGIIGEYLGVVLDENKKRPIYIVKDTINIKHDDA